MNRNQEMVLIGIVILVFCAFVGTVSAADIYVPDNYEKIQWAVDNASTGGTIIVRDGTYNENVEVRVSLTIRSENGPTNCIIDAGGGNAFYVFEPLSSPDGIEYVTINGFTVTGGSHGIYLYGACNHNTITNNVVSNNDIGIYVDYADGSGHNSITNNIVSDNNGIGITLWAGAYHNTVADNTVSDEISVRQSYSNIIANNTIAGGGRISLDSMSQNNLIYNNEFEDYENAYDSGNNAWNIEKTAGTNIIGGPYLGGNYWGDYTGSDTDDDELGDTPYEIPGGENKDYLPLVEYVPDTTPPASITNLQNETGETWINWMWDNPPDADFDQVMVYVDGVWETNTSEEFYTATGLAPETAYELGTRTVDQMENINETWVNQTTKTTAAVSDTMPPDTTITAGPSGTINYNEVTFEWTGSDDITETSKLVYQYTLDGSSWSDWTSGTSKTYTDLANGEYTFRVKAKDEAGIEDPTPASRSFTVSVTIRRSSGGGGGGGTSLDSDGDGYFDTVEIMIGTDPNDPNDYPNKEAATPTPTLVQSTTTMSTITTPTPTVTPTVPAPGGTPTPSPATPTPEEPGFEAIFTVAGLLTIAYVVLRRRG